MNCMALSEYVVEEDAWSRGYLYSYLQEGIFTGEF